MPLSDTKIRQAKPGQKQYKLFDERGLYLIVSPRGGKWWRLKYYFNRKERHVSLGTYPDVSLQKARTRRDEARAQVADGIDPAAEKKAREEGAVDQDTFEAIAREWLALQKPDLAESSYNKSLWLLQQLFPTIGERPISELTPPDLLAAIRKIEDRGVNETAHRAKQKAGQVFRYAIATGRAERDPTSDLRNALAPVKGGNHAALTQPDDIAELMRAIHGYEGNIIAAKALQLAPLVFVRPGELRRMEWAEVSLKSAEWRIPAKKMKMSEEHIVPLSKQALAILKELEGVTGEGAYVFPSIRSDSRPMSENTLNAALRRLGYSKDEMTAHGFRAMASTRLNELGWSPEVIERQLAHRERNKVRAAYNRAQHLEERRQMMQAWADYLDELRGVPRKPSGPVEEAILNARNARSGSA
jgi:integrase